jgi:xylulokinase
MLAAVALGELTFDDIPGRVRVTASYRPDPGTAGLYAMLYNEFVGLYKRNHKAHARLNAARSG